MPSKIASFGSVAKPENKYSMSLSHRDAGPGPEIWVHADGTHVEPPDVLPVRRVHLINWLSVRTPAARLKTRGDDVVLLVEGGPSESMLLRGVQNFRIVNLKKMTGAQAFASPRPCCLRKYQTRHRRGTRLCHPLCPRHACEQANVAFETILERSTAAQPVQRPERRTPYLEVHGTYCGNYL